MDGIVDDAAQHVYVIYTRLCATGFRKAVRKLRSQPTVSTVAADQVVQRSPGGERVCILHRSVHAGL